MKTKIFPIMIVIAFSLILAACAFAAPTPINEAAGYSAVIVEDVQVEVGVGSPIPVHVNVSGRLPDTCSQIEYSEIRQDGSNFSITLSTVVSTGGDCVQDPLPFRMSLPLNGIDLPAGDYSATVNGSRADFSLASGSSVSPQRTADMPVVKDDIQVDDVKVEIGFGSPIPVKAVISGNLPNACAQLGEVRLHRDGKTFFVRLVAYLPGQTECSPDTIPFRLEIPLNIVNLPEGPYEVNVNGVTVSFDP